jgi:hypothetical protein
MTASRIVFTPYRPEHYAALRPQPSQMDFAPTERPADYAAALGLGGFTTTAVEYFAPSSPRADSPSRAGRAFPMKARILGLAGILPQGAGRAVAWAILADRPGRHFLAMTRRAKRGVDMALETYERIETYVDAEWPAAVMWARALGFEPERRARRFAHGRDAIVFVRFAEERTRENSSAEASGGPVPSQLKEHAA